MASFFSFSSPLDIEVRLDGEEDRTQVDIKSDKDRKEKCPVYFDGETIRGQVRYTSPLPRVPLTDGERAGCRSGERWEGGEA